jgi:hypothetical protein
MQIKIKIKGILKNQNYIYFKINFYCRTQNYKNNSHKIKLNSHIKENLK